MVFKEVALEVILTDIDFSRIAAVWVFKLGIRCKVTGSPAPAPAHSPFITILAAPCQHSGVEIPIISKIAFFIPNCR